MPDNKALSSSRMPTHVTCTCWTTCDVCDRANAIVVILIPLTSVLLNCVNVPSLLAGPIRRSKGVSASMMTTRLGSVLSAKPR
eukprot:scaffold88552_cov30-Prasinocladus_malaysianus.AAC.1